MCVLGWPRPPNIPYLPHRHGDSRRTNKCDALLNAPHLRPSVLLLCVDQSDRDLLSVELVRHARGPGT